MYRVTTRPDFDGLVSAALLSILEDVDRYRFTEPGIFQHGEGEVLAEDIITNLPYRHGCALWFDHHFSSRVNDVDFRGSWWIAPSATRVIYEYYGGLAEFDELIAVTDRIDSAQLTRDEILKPRDHFLVSLTIDGKRPQDEPYWLRLIELLQQNDLKLLMSDRDVQNQCSEFHAINDEFILALTHHSEVSGNILLTDLRGVWHRESGNRFIPYVLYPDVDIWIKVIDHHSDPEKTRIAVGHSIFKRTSPVNVGQLLSKYGGGGHRGAGSCRPFRNDTERILKEIVEFCRHE
ncbi:MAG: hypothetical protein P9M15_03275 [Candidatus Electryoneaceae bacterium]|nr:hypothetical protein [Candidatus Electryoneaceae bacterium]